MPVLTWRVTVTRVYELPHERLGLLNDLEVILAQLLSDSMDASSFATASPTSLVVDLPRISAVQIPLSIVRLTASSTAFASSGRDSEYWSSIAMDRIAATGFTIPFPEISGAEPGYIVNATKEIQLPYNLP